MKLFRKKVLQRFAWCIPFFVLNRQRINNNALNADTLSLHFHHTLFLKDEKALCPKHYQITLSPKLRYVCLATALKTAGFSCKTQPLSINLRGSQTNTFEQKHSLKPEPSSTKCFKIMCFDGSKCNHNPQPQPPQHWNLSQVPIAH